MPMASRAALSFSNLSGRVTIEIFVNTALPFPLLVSTVGQKIAFGRASRGVNVRQLRTNCCWHKRYLRKVFSKKIKKHKDV